MAEYVRVIAETLRIVRHAVSWDSTRKSTGRLGLEESVVELALA
jgi:hypothetical protein